VSGSGSGRFVSGETKLGCRCEGSRAERMRQWIVTVLRANYSAFSGYRWTPSDYSEVRCRRCGARWRTKASYVDRLPKQGNA
jgi:hypothetical protein